MTATLPAGMRPYTPHQIILQAIYTFAAIAHQYGKMIYIILPTANTDMMKIFLEHISKEFTGSFLKLPFQREPDFDATSVTYDLAKLLKKAQA